MKASAVECTSRKVMLIIGASSGLGAKLAPLVCSEVDLLLICGRDQQKLAEVANTCLGKRAEIRSIICDVEEEIQLRNLSAEIQSIGKLDYLVYCAGVSMWSSFANLHADPKQAQMAIKKLFNVNFFGFANALVYFLPLLRKSKGQVTLINSVQTFLPINSHSYYSASKRAANGLVEVLRQEELDIDFLEVYPSWIKGTELNLRRVYDERGDKQVKASEQGLDPEKCAQKICSAIFKRHKHLFLPRRYKILAGLYLYWGEFIRKQIRKKVSRHK